MLKYQRLLAGSVDWILLGINSEKTLESFFFASEISGFKNFFCLNHRFGLSQYKNCSLNDWWAYVQFRGSEFHTRNARFWHPQEQRRAKAGVTPNHPVSTNNADKNNPTFGVYKSR